jgi:hypothetical protein
MGDMEDVCETLEAIGAHWPPQGEISVTLKDEDNERLSAELPADAWKAVTDARSFLKSVRIRSETYAAAASASRELLEETTGRTQASC